MNAEKIGFIGLGNMGHPMAKNLEKAGFPLYVYNRTTKKSDDFKAKSTVSSSISDLVNHSDIVFTMLTNDAAVNEIYTQILKEEIAGKLFVDMSTISQKTSVELSDSLKQKGAALIDAPVAGSTKPAADGTLIIMVGGEKSNVDKAMPYLEKLGKSVKHLGTNGKGLAAKISINYFLSMIYEGLAETVLLSDKLGVSREAMLEIINESASGSGATKIKTQALIDNHFSPAFALDLMLKDINLAKDAGADFPVGNAVLDTYRKAQNQGLGKEDVISVIKYLKS